MKNIAYENSYDTYEKRYETYVMKTTMVGESFLRLDHYPLLKGFTILYCKPWLFIWFLTPMTFSALGTLML